MLGRAHRYLQQRRPQHSRSSSKHVDTGTGNSCMDMNLCLLLAWAVLRWSLQRRAVLHVRGRLQYLTTACALPTQQRTTYASPLDA